jgi:hypothetical protein
VRDKIRSGGDWQGALQKKGIKQGLGVPYLCPVGQVMFTEDNVIVKFTLSFTK